MDDLEAIRRLKNGDIGGLEYLISRYQVKAIRTAYLVTHDEYLSEDIVQEAFIRFYKHIRHFDATRPFLPYFMRSVVNAGLNVLEKEKRITVLEEDEQLLAFENILAQTASTEQLAEYAMQRNEIEQILERLSPRQRAVIVQRYYLEMSEKEMAESLDIASGTVKWLLNTARNRLRSLFGVERMTE